MAEITRKPALAAKDTYDLIIIGGGIYGAMLALEAIRRGLYPLLVERDDFGEFTSSNSLRIIHATQTREIFSDVDTEGLQGGAIWYDAFMPDSQRVLMEILRWACNYGATALNYVEAVQLLKDKKGIAGIIAIDHESGQYHEFRTNVVVNACGPWCRDIAARFDRDEPTLFRSMMAWNVLFNRKALV